MIGHKDNVLNIKYKIFKEPAKPALFLYISEQISI